jgi:hypothetical protein
LKRKIEFETEGKSLNNFKVYQINSDGQELLQEIISHKKLVAFISEAHCNTCVDYLLYYLTAISKKIGKENILIFGQYQNNRDFLARLYISELKDIEAYMVAIESQDIPVVDYNIPFFFVTDSTLKIINLFVVDKSLDKMTIDYFNSIVKHFANE